MTSIPAEELEQTRHALAPTLEAANAILPWLSKPRELRFAPELNERWQAASQRLASAWSNRYLDGDADVRPALFALYSIGLESADPDCLRFGEALASTADRLETTHPGPKLIAAFSAAVENLITPDGLEHPSFGERCRHFSQRLESLLSEGEQEARSPVIDRLFVGEAEEHLDAIRDALAALPPDVYGLKLASEDMAHHAEQLELSDIAQQARRLFKLVGNKPSSLDYPWYRVRIEKEIDELARLISLLATVDR